MKRRLAAGHFRERAHLTIWTVGNAKVDQINLADAKAHFREIIERAEAGESIEITRRGRPVARLTAAAAPRKPIDAARLRALTQTMPAPAQDAAHLVRAMRDGERY